MAENSEVEKILRKRAYTLTMLNRETNQVHTKRKNHEKFIKKQKRLNRRSK